MTFEVDGRHGRVHVRCDVTTDPVAVGAGSGAKGLPHLTAQVEYDGVGYRTLFGWVQLVKSTDNTSNGRAFEMDPFEPFAHFPSPYCYYGFEPTLFDAPSRQEHNELNWVANSFLTYLPPGLDDRSVFPVLGFSWGFAIGKTGEVTVEPVTRLWQDAWMARTADRKSVV